MSRDRAARVLFVAGAIACLVPGVTNAAGLIAGILLAVALGNPFLLFTKKWTPRLLQASVVGLGFGMNLVTVLKVGAHGIGYTIAGISLAFVAGELLRRALSVSRDVGLLVTVGTAICGGSAIAAVAPVIRAKDQDVSVALATVFLLNSVGLILFPRIGYALAMTPEHFGLWSALAIHDTSSVVGAASEFDKHFHFEGIALGIATTVKLARALWIVPLTLLIGAFRKQDASSASGATRAAKPWFILGFLLAAAIVSFVPGALAPGKIVFLAARQLLVLTLFLIGANLSRAAITSVGARPLLFGVLLWIAVATASLAALLTGVIG